MQHSHTISIDIILSQAPLYLLMLLPPNFSPITSLLRPKCRFDRLEPAQIQPRAEKHNGKVEGDKDPRDAEIEPDLGVENVEPSSLLVPVRFPFVALPTLKREREGGSEGGREGEEAKQVKVGKAYEFISVGILTEFAQTIGSVLNIPAHLCDITLGITLTCLAWGRRKPCKFVRCADYRTIVNRNRQEALEHVPKRSQIVHP